MATVCQAAGLQDQVRGDFDHDGKQDLALFVPRDGGFDLRIRLASGGPDITLEHFDRLDNIYIEKAAPGTYKTWCGKGGGADDDPCPATELTLTGDVLAFGAEESSQVVAVWDGKAFQITLMSD